MVDDAVTILKRGTTITTSGASSSTTLPTDSGGNVPKYCRLSATAACYVQIGQSGLTAAAGDILVQPADAVIVRTWGQTNVAAIQVIAAGILQISPLEDM